MKSLMNISLAAILATSSIVAMAPEAMAKQKRHHQEQVACLSDNDVGGIIVLGAILGAVTGGIGSAVVYGGAYAVGGAAIGGGVGLGLGLIQHGHDRCA